MAFSFGGSTQTFGTPAPAPSPAFSFGGTAAPAPAPAAGGLFGNVGAPAPAAGGFFGNVGAPAPAPAAGGFSFQGLGGGGGFQNPQAPPANNASAAAGGPHSSPSLAANAPGSKLVSSGEQSRVIDLKELNVEKDGEKVGDMLIQALRDTNTQMSSLQVAAMSNKAKIESIRKTFIELRSKMASCERRVSNVVASQGKIKKHGLVPLREDLEWVSRQVHTTHERTRLYDAALQASYVEGGGRGMRSALPSPVLQEVEELSRTRARVLLAQFKETEDVSKSLGNSPLGIVAGAGSHSHLQMMQLRPEAKLAAEVNHMLSVLFPSLGGALAVIAAENVNRMETECGQLRTTLENILDKAQGGGGGIGGRSLRISPFDVSDSAESERKENERRQIKKGLEDKLKSTLKETAKKAAEKKAEELAKATNTTGAAGVALGSQPAATNLWGNPTQPAAPTQSFFSLGTQAPAQPFAFSQPATAAASQPVAAAAPSFQGFGGAGFNFAAPSQQQAPATGANKKKK